MDSKLPPELYDLLVAFYNANRDPNIIFTRALSGNFEVETLDIKETLGH